MTRSKHLRLGGLGALAAIVITILALVWSGLADPVTPPGAAKTAAAAGTHAAADARWGHDQLTPVATTGKRSVIEPRLPASSVPLATQRPFVTPPARTAPPTLPAAYARALPPPATPAR